jgi:hypothetical protein
MQDGRLMGAASLNTTFTALKRISLSGTNLASSRLGFGLSGMHHVFWGSERQRLLATVHECGITYFDSSPYYGHGLGERELGKFARTRRHDLIIATKVGIHANPLFSRRPWTMYPLLAANSLTRRLTRRNALEAPRRDYSIPAILKSVEFSLRNLRTDHLDILYLHDPSMDRIADPAELFTALRELKQSGKVRYFGLAGRKQDCLELLNFAGESCLLQINAAAEAGLQPADTAGLCFHASYGHFRGQQGSLSKLLAHAAAINPRGVILFSSRRPAHVHSMVHCMNTLERPCLT